MILPFDSTALSFFVSDSFLAMPETASIDYRTTWRRKFVATHHVRSRTIRDYQGFCRSFFSYIFCYFIVLMFQCKSN